MNRCLCVYFAFEAAVDEDEVAYGEGHAEEPPSQAYGQGVGAGERTGKRDVAIRAGGGGQQCGIDAPASAGQHEEQIERGREEGPDGLMVAIEVPDGG